MVDFPKRIKSDGFWLEKVKPTFEVANHLFNIVKNQRAYLAKWLEWVDFSNSPEDMYPHLLKSSQTNNANYYIVLNKEVIGAISLIIINMLLTLIAGLIPSRVASKKDPVEALRVE